MWGHRLYEFVRHRRRQLVVAGAITTLLVVAALLVLTQVTRPNSTAAARYELTHNAAKYLKNRLSDDDWDCYESELGGAEIHRCFWLEDWKDGSDPGRASTTLLVHGDRLVSVKSEFPEVSGKHKSKLGKQIATLYDDAFTSGSDTKIARTFSATPGASTTMLSDTVLLSKYPDVLRLLDVSHDSDAWLNSIIPRPLPPSMEIMDLLEDHKFDCSRSDYLYCEREIAGVDVRFTVENHDDLNADSGRAVTVRIASTESTKQTAKAKAKVGKLLADKSIELTDSAGADLLAASPLSGQRADFADLEMSIREGTDSESEWFTFAISPITGDNRNAAGW